MVRGPGLGMANTVRTIPVNDRPPAMELRTFYNPERRSPVNTVPGLIGVILTMTMTMFTTFQVTAMFLVNIHCFIPKLEPLLLQH